MTQYILNQDVLIYFGPHQKWVLFNPFVKSQIAVESELLQGLGELGEGADEKTWREKLSASVAYDQTQFAQAKGLMQNPNGYAVELSQSLQGDELFNMLCQRWILIEKDKATYHEYLKPKTSLLDQKHQGNFHQKLGSHLLLHQRVKETWKWWHEQKFSEDGLTIKPGLYHAIQESFVRQFFSAQKLAGKKILDYACGNGFYSGVFASHGAHVVGMDTAAELIEIAKRNHANKVKFIHQANMDAMLQNFDEFADGSFDMVYMSDALLFFFYELSSHTKNQAYFDKLLQHFFRILKPKGMFYLMEPNGLFWLAPWLGSVDRPLTVISNFARPHYQVAPTFDKVIQAITKNAFLLQSFVHPDINALAITDKQALAFAQEFPLWDFYQFIALKE